MSNSNNPPIYPALLDIASKGPHLSTTEDIAMDMASATNSGRKNTPPPIRCSLWSCS